MDNLPTKKISETLLEFVEPLLAEAASEEAPTLAQVEQMFGFGVMIWNTVVLQAWPEEDGAERPKIEDIRAKLQGGGAPDVILTLFDTMVSRKRLLFFDDLRAVGDFSVSLDDAGALRVKAEARLPPSMVP